MYQTLINLDHQIFLFINHLPHTPFSDTIALTLSGVYASTTIIWLLLALWLFVREEKRDHWFFFPVVLVTVLSELFTNQFLKNIFTRSRPPAELGAVNIGSLLSDYSFPSGHATIAWAFAVILSAKEPRAKYFFYLLAFFISLSRVYLGKHYPADILVGNIVGTTIGLVALWVEKRFVIARPFKRRRDL